MNTGKTKKLKYIGDRFPEFKGKMYSLVFKTYPDGNYFLNTGNQTGFIAYEDEVGENIQWVILNFLNYMVKMTLVT